jgi:hypothetical protein
LQTELFNQIGAGPGILLLFVVAAAVSQYLFAEIGLQFPATGEWLPPVFLTTVLSTEELLFAEDDIVGK